MPYQLTGYDQETGDPTYDWVDDPAPNGGGYYGPPAPDPSLGGDGYGPPAPAPAPAPEQPGGNVPPPVTITTPRGPTGHTPPPAPDLLPMPQLPPGIGGPAPIHGGVAGGNGKWDGEESDPTKTTRAIAGVVYTKNSDGSWTGSDNSDIPSDAALDSLQHGVDMGGDAVGGSHTYTQDPNGNPIDTGGAGPGGHFNGAGQGTTTGGGPVVAPPPWAQAPPPGAHAVPPGVPKPKMGLGDSLLKSFGLTSGDNGIDWSGADWSKLLGAGFGAATLVHGLNQQPYSPTSAADLLKKQPSNTPTWSADQTAAMRQPLQFGNHPSGGSSIVAGNSMPLTMSQFGQQPNAAPRQLPAALSPLGAGYQPTNPPGFAEGGSVGGALSMLGDSGQAFSGAVQGDDPGQSDLIDAKLSAGEYVLDAETVSMLGDGNTAAGVAKLDELRQKLREQKRSAPNGEIPDTVQGPLTSLLGGQANG